MLTREKLTQAVNLAIAIERGWYTGTVLKDKQRDLEELKSGMGEGQPEEFRRRVNEY